MSGGVVVTAGWQGCLSTKKSVKWWHGCDLRQRKKMNDGMRRTEEGDARRDERINGRISEGLDSVVTASVGRVFKIDQHNRTASVQGLSVPGRSESRDGRLSR